MSSHDDFPKVAAESAQSLLGGESAESDSPLEAVAAALKDLMDRRAQYYDSFDPSSPQESRREHIARELRATQDEVKNAPPPRAHRKISIFSAQQSRDVGNDKEWANYQTLEDLYSTLNKVAGHGAKDYHDIKADAQAAKAANLYIRADSAYRYLMDFPVVGLSSSKDQLFGVQLKIAPDVFATFTLDNLENESAPHDAEVMLTVIVGESTTRR